MFYVKDLTPKQAKKELKSLDQVIPILFKFKSTLEPIDDQEILSFKETAIEFFNTVDVFYYTLQEVAQVHSSYEMSLPVLGQDWDSKEDTHWDNY